MSWTSREALLRFRATATLATRLAMLHQVADTTASSAIDRKSFCNATTAILYRKDRIRQRDVLRKVSLSSREAVKRSRSLPSQAHRARYLDVLDVLRRQHDVEDTMDVCQNAGVRSRFRKH